MRLAPSPALFVVFVAGLLVGTGCLESVSPPGRTPQATVAFTERLYLQGEGARGFCRGLFEGVDTSSDALGDLTPIDGVAPLPADDGIPHNCYVEIATASIAEALPVDVHEVTNQQYQLCVDSGACRAPDPSKVTKTDVCESEGGFDECPVVSVSVQQAEDFCEWVGRRLPSGLEQMLIRQAGLTNAPSGLPATLPILPIGDEIPTSCGQSVLGNGDCDRPFPVFGSDGNIGAAPGDALEIAMGKGSGTIYDLVGNVAEILADLAPDQRGTADGLPWFCIADLPERTTNPNAPFDVDSPPRCPEGLACVRGRYRPRTAPDRPELPIRDDWPVCIGPTRGPIAGFRPVLVGGSYFERLVPTAGAADGVRSLPAREAAGIFARRVLETEEPTRLANTQVGRRTGFRCVGQRMSADRPDGEPPPFEDRLILLPRP